MQNKETFCGYLGRKLSTIGIEKKATLGYHSVISDCFNLANKRNLIVRYGGFTSFNLGSFRFAKDIAWPLGNEMRLVCNAFNRVFN